MFLFCHCALVTEAAVLLLLCACSCGSVTEAAALVVLLAEVAKGGCGSNWFGVNCGSAKDDKSARNVV